ncbi:hypothetical protein [Paenibacillus arenosi]|uniref:Uncharacterized protein n=1 Tax=Paenibacillus arenosi TaxID=2774142 RepID=A0ABR9B0M4_9BACL|nr:hypothetical protein [Paenibacillus arenosi]MBD8498997.1 hypothetical protein [Paenibacillus arenosi]
MNFYHYPLTQIGLTFVNQYSWGGIIIGALLELLAGLLEVFVSSREDAEARERRIDRRIKKLVKEQEWFDLLYQDERYRNLFHSNAQVREKLLDRKYMRTLEQSVHERDLFQRELDELALLVQK